MDKTPSGDNCCDKSGTFACTCGKYLPINDGENYEPNVDSLLDDLSNVAHGINASGEYERLHNFIITAWNTRTPAATVVGWRPIAEAPEKSPVLVFDEEFSVRIAVREDGYWWSGHDDYGNDRRLLHATHFQPLPAPPAPEPLLSGADEGLSNGCDQIKE